MIEVNTADAILHKWESESYQERFLQRNLTTSQLLSLVSHRTVEWSEKPYADAIHKRSIK